jgi:hypothetical protein
MDSPVPERVRWWAGVGSAWNCWCVVAAVPVLLLNRSMRTLLSRGDVQRAMQDDGLDTAVFLFQFDTGIAAVGVEILVRIAYLAALCLVLTGHRVARWTAVIASAVLVGQTWSWNFHWWNWLIDLALVGGLLWVMWTPDPNSKPERSKRRSVRHRVIVVPTNLPEGF